MYGEKLTIKIKTDPKTRYSQLSLTGHPNGPTKRCPVIVIRCAGCENPGNEFVSREREARKCVCRVWKSRKWPGSEELYCVFVYGKKYYAKITISEWFEWLIPRKIFFHYKKLLPIFYNDSICISWTLSSVYDEW